MSKKLWLGLGAVFLILFVSQAIFNIRRHFQESKESDVPEIIVDMATLNETILAEELEPKPIPKNNIPKAKVSQVSSSDLPKDMKEIQRALKSAGFNPGAIDGKLGSQTEAAIKNFQKVSNLKVDGRVGRNTWRLLKKYLKD
ncbi:MAG: peptidoglycan-binding domain-containing protein [Candidatus Omnitrophota bacterium]